MVVVETAKRAAYLGIAKMTGRVKGGDSARERLSDSEMSSLPRNFFSKTDQPASDTRDRSLLCALCGLDVQLYASSEIKAQLDGCINASIHPYNRHPKYQGQSQCKEYDPADVAVLKGRP